MSYRKEIQDILEGMLAALQSSSPQAFTREEVLTEVVDEIVEATFSADPATLAEEFPKLHSIYRSNKGDTKQC